MGIGAAIGIAPMAVFYAIGNYSVMFHSIKNAPRRSALRRKRSTSLKRPAAGGESCEQDSFSLEECYGIQSIRKNRT